MSDRLPWMLLLTSWTYFSAPEKVQRIVQAQKQKLPWILLVLSWIWFYTPRDPWKRFMKLLGKRQEKKHIAKYVYVMPTPKITELESQTDLSEQDKDSIPKENSTARKLTEMHVDELLEEVKPRADTLPQTHRFSKEANTGIEIMKRVCPIDDWQFQQENNGIQISVLPMDGLDLPFIRGDGLIPGEYTLEEVLGVIQSPFARKYWDPRFDQAQVLEFLSCYSVLVFSIQKGTFPVAARDLVTVTTVVLEENELNYVVSSCKDNQAPSAGTGGRVRAELMLAGWKLQKKDNGVYTSYIVHVDPKGSVPSAIIRTVQAQTPMCIKGVSNFLSEKGTLPFVLLGKFAPSPDLFTTKHEITDKVVSMTYTIKPSLAKGDHKQGSWYLALPSATFGNGCKITTTTNTPIEFHSRLVPRSELANRISKSTAQVVHIWSSGVNDNVDVQFHCVPGDKHTLNGKQII